MFSEYKSCCTVKFMAGTALNGASTDRSEGRGGACDLVTLTVASGMLERAYLGFSTLTDKGFIMHAQWMEVMHELLTPPMERRKAATFSTDEMNTTHNIGARRAHVERTFKRGQGWKALHRRLKLSSVDLGGSVFTVVMRMANLDKPLLREADEPLKSLAELSWGRRDVGDAPV